MSTATPARPLGLMRSYLELCRASNLPTVWTNTLAAVLLARRGEPFSAGALGAALAVGAALSLFYLGGMALNDVLDVEESSEKLGKTAGKDAAQQKITFPAVYGLERSRQMAEEERLAAHAALRPFDDRADRLRQIADFIVQRKT